MSYNTKWKIRKNPQRLHARHKNIVLLKVLIAIDNYIVNVHNIDMEKEEVNSNYISFEEVCDFLEKGLRYVSETDDMPYCFAMLNVLRQFSDEYKEILKKHDNPSS